MVEAGRKRGFGHMTHETTSGGSCDVTCVVTSRSLLTVKTMDDDHGDFGDRPTDDRHSNN